LTKDFRIYCLGVVLFIFCLFLNKISTITEIPFSSSLSISLQISLLSCSLHHRNTTQVLLLIKQKIQNPGNLPATPETHKTYFCSSSSSNQKIKPIDSAGGEFRRGGEAVRHDGGNPIDGLPAEFTDKAILCFMLLPPARVCYCRPSKSSRSQRRLLFHLHGTDYEGSEALAVDELLQVDGFERRTRCAGTDRIGGLVEPSEPLHGEFLERRAMVEDGVHGTHAEHRRSGCATRRELTRRLDPSELRPPPPASPPHHRRGPAPRPPQPLGASGCLEGVLDPRHLPPAGPGSVRADSHQ
jgi:hypothetical protein